MQLKKIITVVMLFCSCYLVQAQDPYFSQYFGSPLTFNPALTGFFEAKHRFAIQYRSQWSSLHDPYQTGAVSFDSRIMEKNIASNDKWGIGIHALYDQAGRGIYKNNFIALSTAFHKGLDEDGKQSIGIGFQLAYARNNIDFGKVSFGSQFNNSGFDLSIPSGETVKNNAISYVDLNAGILYQFADESGNVLNLGASMYHILQPRLQFFSQQNQSLKSRFTIHMSGDLRIASGDRIFLSGHVMQQARNTQPVVGAAYGWGIGNEDAFLYTGAFARLNDAVYPYLSFRTNSYQLGLSYDITTSSLQNSKGFTNSSEISFTYFFRGNHTKAVKCYQF